MRKIVQHKALMLWYNMFVLRESAGRFFDIGLQTVESRSDLVSTVCETFGLGHSCASQNPRVGCVRRVRRPRELRKRIRRPQNIRNSVLVLPRKPLLSRTRQNTVLRRMAIMRRNLFSYASSRLVVVPLGNMVSRVRRFSVPRRSGSTR